MTRRSLLQASLAAWPSLERLRDASYSLAAITIDDTSDQLRISNNLLTIVIDKQSGRSSYSWMGRKKVTDAYSTAALDSTFESTSYPRHTYNAEPVPLNNRIGKGQKISIVNSGSTHPPLLQHYSVYEGKPFFLVQVEIRSSRPVSTNYLGALVVDSAGGVDVGIVNQNRALRVPFDNDMWVRYHALDINSSDMSSEVTAIYDNMSRNGLVFGSVTHETWKTGIRFSGSNGRLDKLEVFAGMATGGVPSLTHDSLPHGKVTGESVASAVIFVGYYEDWRDGLEEYGRVNAAFQAPLRWDQPIPFGWNSWAAYTGGINYSKYLGAADFIDQKLAPYGFNNKKVFYHNFDASWSHLDVAQLQDALAYLKTLTRTTGIEYRPGIYMTPFAKWGGDLGDFVEGTNTKFRYEDILLKNPDGVPLPRIAGGAPLDPTHPGAKARIRSYIRTFKELGFRYLKVDFLSHGTLEGVHWDKSVETGIQAYNEGMRFLVDEIAGEMFLSLSIAPLFPADTAMPAVFRAIPWATSAEKMSPPSIC